VLGVEWSEPELVSCAISPINEYGITLEVAYNIPANEKMISAGMG
jgi:hypothetical protein